MKAMLELTEWRDVASQPNHVYWVNDSGNKIYAYARWGNPQDVQRFKSPITIDQRGRKFVPVRHDIYDWQDLDDVPQGRVIKVTGSRGDVYTVTEENGEWACTCSGFKFRGRCRHITDTQQIQ